jgi:hypothetical protein
VISGFGDFGIQSQNPAISRSQHINSRLRVKYKQIFLNIRRSTGNEGGKNLQQWQI